MTRAVSLVDVAIEQAIARGLTNDQVAEELAVPVDHVQRVWARMEELAVEYDVAVPVANREQLEVGPHGRPLEPHGTHAAFSRHRGRGEEPCALCRVGERRYNTERKRLRRARAREQVAA